MNHVDSTDSAASVCTEMAQTNASASRHASRSDHIHPVNVLHCPTPGLEDLNNKQNS
jgi:hypothetical protein